jgi:hypothetical protein
MLFEFMDSFCHGQFGFVLLHEMESMICPQDVIVAVIGCFEAIVASGDGGFAGYGAR